MRAAADFTSVMRRGYHSGRNTVVVYVAQTGNADRIAGFAVSRAVGGAVARNRIKRRLRAIAGELLPTLPTGTGVVIRALPASATVPYARLRTDVAGALVAARAKVPA